MVASSTTIVFFTFHAGGFIVGVMLRSVHRICTVSCSFKGARTTAPVGIREYSDVVYDTEKIKRSKRLSQHAVSIATINANVKNARYIYIISL